MYAEQLLNRMTKVLKNRNTCLGEQVRVEILLKGGQTINGLLKPIKAADCELVVDYYHIDPNEVAAWKII